jgi:hypothetical protein
MNILTRRAGWRAATGMVLVSAVLMTACNIFSDSSSTTAPTVGTTETYSDTLAVRGSKFFTFTVVQPGIVSVTLTSLSAGANVAVGLGLGTPNGTTSCTVTSSGSTVVAGSTPQLAVSENPGSYCVQIADVGNLTAASTFSITILHP